MHFKSIFFFSFLFFLAGTLFSQDSPNLWISYKWYGLGSGLGVEGNILTVSGNKLVGNYEVKYHKNELSDISDKDYIREDSVFRIERVEVILKKSSIDSIISLVSPGVDTIYSGNPCVKSGEMREFAINANGNHKVYRMVNSFDSIPEKILKILFPYFPTRAVNSFVPYRLWEHAKECRKRLFKNSLRAKHTPEEWIINRIFKKDPNVYKLNDTLGLFINYEKFRGCNYHFYTLDTSKVGINKYLLEADLPTLKKYQPKLNIFYGKKYSPIHNLGPWLFFAFEHEGRGGFVADSTKNGLNRNFYDILRIIEFQSEDDKEKFGLELFQIMIPDVRFFFTMENKVIESKIFWNEEVLEIENTYSGYPETEKYLLKIEFQGRWIKNINLILKEE